MLRHTRKRFIIAFQRKSLLYWKITREQVRYFFLLRAQTLTSKGHALHRESVCRHHGHTKESSHDPRCCLYLEGVRPKLGMANIPQDIFTRRIQMHISWKMKRDEHILSKRQCKERLVCFGLVWCGHLKVIHLHLRFVRAYFLHQRCNLSSLSRVFKVDILPIK